MQHHHQLTMLLKATLMCFVYASHLEPCISSLVCRWKVPQWNHCRSMEMWEAFSLEWHQPRCSCLLIYILRATSEAAWSSYLCSHHGNTRKWLGLRWTHIFQHPSLLHLWWWIMEGWYTINEYMPTVVLFMKDSPVPATVFTAVSRNTDTENTVQ